MCACGFGCNWYTSWPSSTSLSGGKRYYLHVNNLVIQTSTGKTVRTTSRYGKQKNGKLSSNGSSCRWPRSIKELLDMQNGNQLQLDTTYLIYMSFMAWPDREVRPRTSGVLNRIWKSGWNKPVSGLLGHQALKRRWLQRCRGGFGPYPPRGRMMKVSHINATKECLEIVENFVMEEIFYKRV